MMQMTNIIGILVGVAIVAGLLLAMAKMSEKGADANGCEGSSAAAVFLRTAVPASLRKKKRILPESRC